MSSAPDRIPREVSMLILFYSKGYELVDYASNKMLEEGSWKILDGSNSRNLKKGSFHFYDKAKDCS